MPDPLDHWRQRRARQRYMPQTRRSAGRTAKFAMAALVVIVATAALLELRRGPGAEAGLIAAARDNPLEPLDMLQTAARARRLVVISDIPAAAAPKRLAAELVERLATTSGLDALAVSIPVSEQQYFDRYLSTEPEDVSILLSRPRAIREGDGATAPLLDLYRAVWRVNRELGAARRVRILAIDHPDWPPARATSAADAARTFGARTDHMVEHLHERLLGRNPGARVLLLVDGLHALKSGSGRARTGGARPVDVDWLAARLAQRYPQDVFTVLLDATPARSPSPAVAAYRGTVAGDAMRQGGIRTGTALLTGPAFDAVARSPIRVIETTGLTFDLVPRDAPFTSLADAYVFLGN
jgi:hypothetical protein